MLVNNTIITLITEGNSLCKGTDQIDTHIVDNIFNKMFGLFSPVSNRHNQIWKRPVCPLLTISFEKDLNLWPLSSVYVRERLSDLCWLYLASKIEINYVDRGFEMLWIVEIFFMFVKQRELRFYFDWNCG